jgi:hypothetical protein
MMIVDEETSFRRLGMCAAGLLRQTVHMGSEGSCHMCFHGLSIPAKNQGPTSCVDQFTGFDEAVTPE